MSFEAKLAILWLLLAIFVSYFFAFVIMASTFIHDFF